MCMYLVRLYDSSSDSAPVGSFSVMARDETAAADIIVALMGTAIRAEATPVRA